MRVFRYLLLVAMALLPALTAWSDTDLALRKRADNATPDSPQQTIEFTVEIENLGDVGVTGAQVEDLLPSQLGIPEGMVPVASSGSYDTSSGIWELGELPPGASEILTVPAIIVANPQPQCIVNRARLLGTDSNNGNNAAAAALRLPGVERCADLEVSWARPVFGDDPCGGKVGYDYEIRVWNRGPDAARNVVLTLSETSAFRMPRLAFTEDNCSGLRCDWEDLPAGSIMVVRAVSASFANETLREHAITLALDSSDADPDPANNRREVTREIKVSTRPCPDYGIPNPLEGLGGSGGGCFIATAAYGTPLDPRLDSLRGFRDEYLMPRHWGRALVNSYYRHSPPAADYIAQRPALRALVRAGLAPIVLAIEYPVGALLTVLVAGLVVMLMLWRVVGQRMRG